MGIIDSSWYVRQKGLIESASAGGVVIFNAPGQTLLALVRDNPKHAYVLPKGHIEPGETPEQAARREIEEEAGLRDLELISLLGTRERMDFDKKSWKKISYFLFRAPTQESRPTDKEKAYVCEWFPLDRLPPLFWPEQEELIRENESQIRAINP